MNDTSMNDTITNQKALPQDLSGTIAKQFTKGRNSRLFHRTNKPITLLPALESNTSPRPMTGWCEVGAPKSRRNRDTTKTALLENIKQRVCGEGVG